MFINNTPAGLTATQVWAAVTRTLTADPATDAGSATLVWGHSQRALTAFSTFATETHQAKASLAASGTLNLGSSTKVDFVQITVDNVLIQIGQYDQANFLPTSNGTDFFGGLFYADGNLQIQLKNTDGAAAHNYMWAQFNMVA